MAPGNIVLSTIGIIADDRSVVMQVIVSLIVWSLLVVAGLLLLKQLKNFVRLVGAWVRTGIFRASQELHRLKTKLVLKLREIFPRRTLDVVDVAPTVEFDDLDLAVLRSAAARGPGFTMSAAEIADHVPLRPAQIQRRLQKLSKSKMLESVIGSTDGYENYRLSQLGTAYMASWQ